MFENPKEKIFKMSIKRILCLTLCFALLLCCSACKNVDTFTSSDCINTSSIKDNTSSTESTLTIDKLEKEYGFSSIKDVKYYCVKNVPESDAIYTITQIINNHDNNVCDYTFDVLCENKDVKIDDNLVLITAHRRENHGERIDRIIEAIKYLAQKYNTK